MFSRDESSRMKREFWTTFGKYMAPVPSTDGTKVNWVNYHTRVKDLYFRMDASQKSATISISMEHRDRNIQQHHFEQFLQLKSVLHQNLGEEWTWQLHTEVEQGKTISRIYTELKNVSVFNKSDWPALISFFKPRMIALDRFWEDAKWNFES